VSGLDRWMADRSKAEAEENERIGKVAVVLTASQVDRVYEALDFYQMRIGGISGKERRKVRWIMDKLLRAKVKKWKGLNGCDGVGGSTA
jgi:hypothetical protein